MFLYRYALSGPFDILAGMQYGFVIDQNSCIGCHACTVACKAENDVPVSNFRTSVKYTEEGTFPQVKRHFLVQRCNHCTDAPCVTICPVRALDKRKDGIVDIDRDACIGCRACMQACPYDALYLNEDLGAVEKCHFCAHRVDVGLQPACVNVCPVEAIIPGDMHDPESRVSKLIREDDTKVRRPEQRTGPNVHYLGAADISLNPGQAERPETYLWSDRPPFKEEAWPISLPVVQDAKVVLDTAGHRVEWGWPVAMYLVTKGVGAGAAMLSPFVAAMGLTGFFADYLPEILGLVFTAITCVLLVEDLTKPMTFYRMMTRPNWKSWLVRGGVILTAFIGVLVLTIGLRMMGHMVYADALRWLNAAVGLAVAGYTAFLFAQCKGRDLWEGHLLLPHLLVQAAMVGAGCFLAFSGSSWQLFDGSWVARLIVILSAVVHLVISLAERFGQHPTDNARQAAAFLGVVRLGKMLAFRESLIIGVGITIGFALILPGLVFVPALVGLFLYEHAYVRAGQLPPLS